MLIALFIDDAFPLIPINTNKGPPINVKLNHTKAVIASRENVNNGPDIVGNRKTPNAVNSNPRIIRNTLCRLYLISSILTFITINILG